MAGTVMAAGTAVAGDMAGDVVEERTRGVTGVVERDKIPLE